MPCPRFSAPLVLGLALTLGVPALAQMSTEPPANSAVPSPLKPGDAFGEEVTLPTRPIVYLTGHSDWEDAFETLVKSYRTLGQYLERQGIEPAGPAMTIYTHTDDMGFDFRAAWPVSAAPKDVPKGDIALGQAPSGKALKFVHRGSYDALDQTYEAITNYLDEKQLEAKNEFIEEYIGDVLKLSPDNLVVNIYVPVK